MQFKSITAIIVLFLLVASLSVAGCTMNLNAPASSSPSPTTVSPSPAPTVTSTPRPSNILGANVTMAALTKGLKDSGSTILEPFTSSTNSAGNAVLTAKYRTNTGSVYIEKVDLGADGSWTGTNANTGNLIMIARSNDLMDIISVETA